MLPLYLGEMLHSGKAHGHLNSALAQLLLQQELTLQLDSHSVTTETQEQPKSAHSKNSTFNQTDLASSLPP